jgi:hypothetical protein
MLNNRVTSVKVVRDFILEITFADGKSFALDFRPMVESESGWLYDGLKVPEVFQPIILNFVPCGLDLRQSEPLLKQRQTQSVPQFEPVEAGERQRRRVGLTPRIGPRGIRIGCVKRKEKAGIGVGLHQRSSARPAMTIFGRTLFPKILRRRAE